MTLRILSIAALAATLALATPSLAVDTGGGSNTFSVNESMQDARAQIRNQRWADAIGTLRLVLEAEPNNADANNLMGYSLRKSGKMQRAEGFYLKALKLSPRHKGANEYLGELYVETGNLGKAKVRLEALEAICGTGCEEYQDLKTAIDKAS
jgi:Flp pilus assembly protein TadD